MLHFTEGLTVTNSINFTFSDLVAGYVQNYDQDTDVFTLRTSWYDGHGAQAYVDASSQLRDLLGPGRSSTPTACTTPTAGPTRSRPSTSC